MSIIKVLLLSILFYSMSCYAINIDAEHPFLQIGQSVDGSILLFIGAFGEYLPHKVDSGDILIRALQLQIKDADNYPKGQLYEYAILVDCKQNIAKILVIRKKENEKSQIEFRYTDKGKPLSGQKLEDKIAEDFNKEPADDVGIGTMLSVAVNSGCHYMGEQKPVAPPEKKKPREWTA